MNLGLVTIGVYFSLFTRFTLNNYYASSLPRSSVNQYKQNIKRSLSHYNKENMSCFLESKNIIKQLPKKIIVGYANWNQCDDKIIESVKSGVNVVIWFSINLSIDETTGTPSITNGPNMDCVAEKINIINDLGLETIHLISIGGWNSPHPNTKNSVEDVYHYWDYWNRNIISRPEKGFFGFDGFDWDIEGNDDFKSVYNHFSVECLDLMGKMSQLAKREGDYIVAMAPAESYLDPNFNSFDRSLLHEYKEWESIQPG
jgi:hypothetical protein